MLRCFLGGMILIVLPTGLVWGQGPDTPPATVEVAVITEGDAPEQRVFVGEIVPLYKSVVGSAVDGRVIRLPATEGMPVAQGEILAELLTDTIELEIAAAQALVDLRRSEWAELDAGSRPEEIVQAEARYDAARAVMVFEKAQFDRVKSLFEQGRSVTRDEFDEAVSASTRAEQEFYVAQASLELVRQGPRQEQKDQAKARWDQVEAELKRLVDQKQKHTIRAPFDGYVSVKFTEVGQWIASGDPVMEVLSLEDIEIEMAVPEKYIPSVEVGHEALVEVDAFPDPDNFIVGTVSRVFPQADVRSRTFPVRIHVDNPRSGDSHKLKSGMLAHVALQVGPAEKSLLIPKDALVLSEQTKVIKIVRPDPRIGNVVQQVPVEVGIAVEDMFKVTGPDFLQAGQQVIVRGNERVFAGQPIQPIPWAEASEPG
jgi:RND family efflux transporter MFP subunit